MKKLFLFGILAGTIATGARAQTPADGERWDSSRALELIRQAQRARAESAADTGLVNYRAEARAYVYFYLDREDTGERNLVKTDQLALEVLWQSPDQTKQRIIGWRDQKSLPTNIHYHLDHLSVVQENFGDEIRLGDGDEVRDVPHPAAPAAEEVYQYRLADSLTLRLPGAAEPVRVYELQVRPRDPSRPALIGSVFVDRASGEIVRMDFTFTAAAYVDPYLDHINISLDNGLWRGRHWLPNEQRVEIRRRIPQLDIPAGSVIRANLRVFGYELNVPIPPEAFRGPPVVALPREQRESFPFEQEIHAELREEGLGPQMELSEIREQAARLTREAALRRVAGLRASLPRASELIRYNRAEGLVIGAGASLTPAPGVGIAVRAGYAFGAEHPLAAVEMEAGEPVRLRASAYLHRPRDVGLGPVVSGAMNTLTSLFAAEDFLDPYYASGAEVGLSAAVSGAWRAEASLRAEVHESAALTQEFSVFGGEFRPVRDPVAVEEEPWVGGELALERRPPVGVGGGWGARAELGWGVAPGGTTVACPGDVAVVCGPGGAGGAFVKPQLRVERVLRSGRAAATLELSGRAGFALGELPRQELYLLGGRGTLPGFAFRRFGGDRYALAEAVASADLRHPWLRGRLLAGIGWAGAGDPGETALELWGAEPTAGPRGSVGAGVGLFYDILRVDLARGIGAGGGWELIVETRRSFWDFL